MEEQQKAQKAQCERLQAQEQLLHQQLDSSSGLLTAMNSTHERQQAEIDRLQQELTAMQALQKEANAEKSRQ